MRRTLALFFVLCTACSGESGSAPSPTSSDFPSELLEDFRNWTPVLNGDIAFASLGHEGQTTRVYFNDIAAPYFKAEKPLPMAPGAYVAKAVVSDSATAAEEAVKVYFMLKKQANYDTENGDWSYTFATRNGDKLSFSTESGKLATCIPCHKQESEWDYVATVDYHRRQSASKSLAD